MITRNIGGLDTTQIRLELDATPNVFLDGKMRLRCLATQFTIYRRSTELELQEDTPQLAPVMGPTAPQSHGNVMSLCFLG